jgi:predicted DNA-binding transcriptional regulator AlpA
LAISCDESRGDAVNDHKSPTAADDLTMLDVEETCRFFGGQKSPIDPSTLYKGIKTGKYPPPVKQGTKTSRWVLGQCRAALLKIIAEQSGVGVAA